MAVQDIEIVFIICHRTILSYNLYEQMTFVKYIFVLQFSLHPDFLRRHIHKMKAHHHSCFLSHVLQMFVLVLVAYCCLQMLHIPVYNGKSGNVFSGVCSVFFVVVTGVVATFKFFYHQDIALIIIVFDHYMLPSATVSSSNS